MTASGTIAGPGTAHAVAGPGSGAESGTGFGAEGFGAELGLGFGAELAPVVELDGDAVVPDGAGLAVTLLDLIAVVEVAFALTSGGLLLVVVWIAVPRLVLAAVLGLILLAVGAVGMARIPVLPGAVLLLVLAAASLVMEVLAAPGLLLHAVGGGVALCLAGLSLAPGSGAHPLAAVAVAVAASAGTWWAARRSWRAVRDDPLLRGERLCGRTGTVLQARGREGSAVIGGEVWTVSALDRPLRPGGRVEVVARAADALIVVPARRPPD